jgi:hypothetical protein
MTFSINRFIASALLSLSCSCLYAQQTEIQLQLNAALLAYRGASSTDETYMIHRPGKLSTLGETKSKLSTMSYGFSGNIKNITHSRIIYGLDGGLELLRSRINITSLTLSFNNSIDATGKGITNNFYLNLFPYVGYRLQIKKCALDFTSGLDLAMLIWSHVEGRATISNGTVYSGSTTNITKPFDLRTRAQLAAQYRKYGMYAGYSLGLINFHAKRSGNSACYASLIRFGLTYRIE